MKFLGRCLLCIFALAIFGFIFPAAQQHTPANQTVNIQTINTNPPAGPVKLIFIHHSSGENWLSDYHGGLGLALQDNNYFVSDTNYGWGPDGIGDRTDIGYWWDWFLSPQRDTFLNALYAESDRFGDYYSRLDHDPGGENEIIMFKGCFPNSFLGGSPNDPPTVGDNPLRGQESWSEAHTVANAKGIYNDLLGYFATRQDKLFVVVTAPPLMDGETDAAHAVNARAFNNWLVNEWLANYPHNNVVVFDFYNVLTSNGGNTNTHDAGAESGNHHRVWNGAVQHLQTLDHNMSAYPDGDSHPTPAGNQKATAEFVPLLNYYYSQWKPGHSAAESVPAPVPPTETPTEEEVPAEEETAPQESETGDVQGSEEIVEPLEAVMPAGIIENFDSNIDAWETSQEDGSQIALVIDNNIIYNGAGALSVLYQLAPNGWVDCGQPFEDVQNWSDGNGISFWIQSDAPGAWVTLTFFSGTLDAPTPFETYFEIPPESVGSWTQLNFPWAVLERAEWADTDGITEFDPAQIAGYALTFAAEDDSVEGQLWVDEIALATEVPPMESDVEEQEEIVPVSEQSDNEEAAPSIAPTSTVEVIESDIILTPPAEEETGGGFCPLLLVVLPGMLVVGFWGHKQSA